MIEPEILAYCAGVVDSDGSISVKRSTYAMRVTKDSAQPCYSERVTVKQVEPQAVELMHSLFGGHRRIDSPSLPRGRPLHDLNITDRKAAICLLALLPYLRIKRAQAENCLDLRALKELSKTARVAFGRGHVGSASRPAELSARMEATYLRSRELNQVAQKRRLDSLGSFCRLCGGWRGCLGLEPTPALYVQHMVELFREIRRVLRPDGTVWLNMGDSYASAPKGSNGNGTSTLSNGGAYQGEKPLPIIDSRRGLKDKDLLMMPARVRTMAGGSAQGSSGCLLRAHDEDRPLIVCRVLALRQVRPAA